jgi:hypothetical protein
VFTANGRAIAAALAGLSLFLLAAGPGPDDAKDPVDTAKGVIGDRNKVIKIERQIRDDQGKNVTLLVSNVFDKEKGTCKICKS